MRLLTFEARGAQALGCLVQDGGAVLDVQAAHRMLGGSVHPALGSMLALIDAGPVGLDLVRALADKVGQLEDAVVPLAAARLHAPLPLPRQIRDFSISAQHIRDAPRGSARMRARLRGEAPPADDPAAVYAGPGIFGEQPIYYHSNRFNIVGPDALIEWPDYCRFLDFELEIGMIIGRRGKNIARADALSHVFGYTIFNDFSARDEQAREMQGRLGPTKGKSFDTGNSLGPWIVTPDEMPDIRAVQVEVRVNDEVWATGSTADFLHDFADILAFVTRSETVHPGELFGSGTVGGCCGLEMDRWLEDGDVVELRVPPIGVLRNQVRKVPAG